MFQKLLKLTIKVRWCGVLLFCIHGVKYLIICILNYPPLKMAALVRNMQGKMKILLRVLQYIIVSGDFIKLIYE